jgi:GT2 family glycosyltransferase
MNGRTTSPATTDSETALVEASRLRDRLTERLTAQRMVVASLEQESRALHDQLSLMERSAGRRMYLGFRGAAVRALLAARHPVWTAGSAARAAASTRVPRTLRAAVRHLRRRTLPLRVSAPVAELTDQPDDFAAIRWIGPTRIRHEILESLLCHPSSTIQYRVSVPSGSDFVTSCALSPNAWRHHAGAVDFRVRLELPKAGWTTVRECRLDPARRYTDRRWQQIRIPLPPLAEPAADVVVSLQTTAAPGSDTGYAWALFGEPRFEWKRPDADVRASVRMFVQRLRGDGLRATFARLSHGRSADEEAAEYTQWVATHTRSKPQLEAHAAEIAVLPVQPLISIITPVFNTDARWLRACIESVRRQTYPNWELCLCDDASSAPGPAAVFEEYADDPRVRVVRRADNAGISVASNAAAAIARGEYLALLDHDDELTPDALAEVVSWINAHPDTQVIYSDEDKLDLAGQRCDPAFKPDWSPELFLHRMYTCHLTVLRREVFESTGGFRTGYEGAQDYDLLLRVMERTDRISHLPRVLYHWRKLPQSTASAGSAKPWAMDAGRLALEDYVVRRGLEAEVLPGGAPGLFRLKRAIQSTPLVSIVIPTAGRTRTSGGTEVDLLAQAVASVKAKTAWPQYEFVIVADAAGVPPSTSLALHGTRHRILRCRSDGPFNFSRKINEGVAASAGEHVVLFNDDLEVIDGEWMSAMLEYSQDAAIGAVGAKLLYPDGRLQHVGMILGVNGIAAHAYHQHPGTISGYMGNVLGPRDYSAVTAACMMTRRAVFDEAGGFDEAFPTDFNDVDFCLKVRKAGLRIVWTPYARLIHHESASFGPRVQDHGGIEEMRRRWRREIECDPYYNPNLTRQSPDFRVGA